MVWLTRPPHTLWRALASDRRWFELALAVGDKEASRRAARRAAIAL